MYMTFIVLVLGVQRSYLICVYVGRRLISLVNIHHYT